MAWKSEVEKQTGINGLIMNVEHPPTPFKEGI
jgi:hypothetical protein